MKYSEFLNNKKITDIPTGLDCDIDQPQMFDFQRDITRWALKRGRAAIFAGCGMGKTLMQLEWAHKIPGRTLILAPLAVAQQTVREGAKFDLPCEYCRDGKSDAKVTIANYEMMGHFEPSDYNGIVLDESSILKSYTGKFRNEIIERFAQTQYKLACTATPSPNDYMELGNHSEFLGVMSRTEMLSMFFVHNGGDTQKWRLKGHAADLFWEWCASWAVMIRKPSDLGYDDALFDLNPIHYHSHIINIHENDSDDGLLFRLPAVTLMERKGERRHTTTHRCESAATIANGSSDQHLIWCDLNNESAELTKLIDGAVEVKGSHTLEYKADAMHRFISGDIRVLVSKPSICGFGMNFQNCHKMVFVGLSDSYEQFYQAVRRCWRFGQNHDVDCHIVTASTEGAVLENVRRKERQDDLMVAEMLQHMRKINQETIHGIERQKTIYAPSKKIRLPEFLSV